MTKLLALRIIFVNITKNTMDIQSILTQAIEVIVMSFVALIIFDFIDGLYVVPLPAIAITQFNANSESTVLPQQIPLYKFSMKMH